MDERASGGAPAILIMVGIVVVLAAAAYIFATPKEAPPASKMLALSAAEPIEGGVAYNVTGNVSGMTWDKLVIKLAGAQGEYTIGILHDGKTAAISGEDWRGSVQYQSKTPIVKGDRIVLTSKAKQSGALLVVMQAADQTIVIQQPVNGL